MSTQRGTVSRDDDDASDERHEPTEQEVFDILSNRRRRYALYALADDDAATIGSLAEQIAAWENDCTIDDITSTERKRVYTALQQSHLPKLERMGLIHFDQETGRVRPTDTVEEMDIYLEVVGEEQLSWDQYYLGLSALSVGIVVAIWLDLPFFRAIPPLLWMTFVVGLFTASAVAHNYRSAGLKATTEPPEVSRQS